MGVVQEKYDMWNKITGSHIKYEPVDQARKERQYARDTRPKCDLTIGDLIGNSETKPKKHGWFHRN